MTLKRTALLLLALNVSIAATNASGTPGCPAKTLGAGTLGKPISGIIQMCTGSTFKNFDARTRKSMPAVKWTELYRIADPDGTSLNDAAGDDIKSRLSDNGYTMVSSHPDDNGGGVIVFKRAHTYISMAIFVAEGGGYMGLVGSTH